jgi:predicted sugar kinase
MERFSAQSRDANQAPPQARQATVTTTARLHFGFLDPSGRGKNPFGSFGLSIDRPRTKLTLEPAPDFTVSGAERDRVERYLRSIAEICGVRQAYALRIEEAIPPHAGLGSGTQLALAVGSAFAAVENIRLSPQEIAARLQRGARSGIGIATFAQGGAVLDAGPCQGKLPELVACVPFPPHWRVLLILDASYRGLAGAVQGGAYASPRVSRVLDWLRSKGLTGLGQSSWGPTGFAFASSEAEGGALLQEAQARHSRPGLSFSLAQGNNEGAKIETG